MFVEDITRWCEDMNFIFEWQNNILRTSTASEQNINEIDKIIEGNYQNYVINKLTCEIMENKPLGSRM